MIPLVTPSERAQGAFSRCNTRLGPSRSAVVSRPVGSWALSAPSFSSAGSRWPPRRRRRPRPRSRAAGTDFWVTFPSNYETSGPTYTLLVSGTSAGTGTVTDAGGSPVPFSVSPGSVTSLSVTGSVTHETVDAVVNQGIHVVATTPVTVYGLNLYPATSDAYTALPTDALGTRYRVGSYAPLGSSYPSRLTVVGTADGTTVTVTPSVTAGSHAAETPFTVSIDQGEVYSLTAGANDLTGSLVTADHPVAVYGSDDCSDINVGGNGGACDTLVQQMTPTSAWGHDFAAVRFLKDEHGDPFRIVADTDGTVVTVDGMQVATIDAGEHFDDVYAVPPTSGPPNLNVGVHITTSHPAMVIQYQTGGTYRQGSTVTSGDPSMMLVPPTQQYLASYTIATPPSQFTVNHVNVTIPTAVTSSLRLDHAAVSASEFNPIAGTNLSSAQLPLSLGTHTLTASLPFGVFVYGENGSDSYAYPGGYAAAAIASVASLTPAATSVDGTVGTQFCIPVTVRDNHGAVVAGVRVDAVTTGANSAATFATSNSSGIAIVCYTPAEAGTDAITFAVGAITAHATAVVTSSGGDIPTGGGAAANPAGSGYWSLSPAGVLTAHGDAHDYGNENDGDLNAPIVAINSTTTGHGYWLVSADGGVFAYGDASFYGSVTAKHLNQNIVAIARTPDDHGYWLVAADGGVFAFGNAKFYGSMGGSQLTAPIVAIDASKTGHGYWLAAADGGVFGFGDATFYGSMGEIKLNAVVNGIAATPDGRGYWMVAGDGGVFAFGDANFYGSAAAGTTPMVAIVANDNAGYRLISTTGVATSFGTMS